MKAAVLGLLCSCALAAQTVEGNVFDALTGAPVMGAIVSVSHPDRLSARTDAAGHFRLSSTQGFLFVHISRAGYIVTNRNVRVDAKRPASNLRIDLTPTAVISGTLVDEEGSPIEGARVSAQRYRLVNGERKLQPGMGTWAQSDDLGMYRIANLPAGRYYIRASAGRAGNWDSRYMVEFYPGTLQPTAEGLVEVKTGEQRRGIDLRFTKHEGVNVEGRIVMADGVAPPRFGPHIYLSTNEFGVPDHFVSRLSSEGAFHLTHVPPGVYTLHAMSDDYPPRAGDLFGEQRLTVGDSDVRDVALAVRTVKPVDVSGTVLFEGGATSQTVIINVRPMAGAGATFRSDDQGTFTLQGLLPGHHDLQIMPDFHTVSDSPEKLTEAAGKGRVISARLGDKEVLYNGFDLDGSPAPPLTVTFSNRKYEVSGKVLDASGKPVDQALVHMDSGQPGGAGTGISKADGTFFISLREPGQYHIYVVDQSQSDAWNDSDYLEAHANDFPPVAVAEGENPPVTLRWPVR